MILNDDRDLEVDFTDAIDAFVFDQMTPGEPKYHGVDEMHRVDWIVEFPESVLYVEVKDPEHPKAQAKGLAKMLQKLEDGKLAKTFTEKFVDTFVYGWAEEKLNKPIHYLNLVTWESALNNNLEDQIAGSLPPMRRKTPRWKRALAESCLVFNLDTWNQNFPKWPARRRGVQ